MIVVPHARVRGRHQYQENAPAAAVRRLVCRSNSGHFVTLAAPASTAGPYKANRQDHPTPVTNRAAKCWQKYLHSAKLRSDRNSVDFSEAATGCWSNWSCSRARGSAAQRSLAGKPLPNPKWRGRGVYELVADGVAAVKDTAGLSAPIRARGPPNWHPAIRLRPGSANRTELGVGPGLFD